MTKEICEKCEFTEESHKIFEKDPMEYHGLKKPCEKFKAKNNSPLENVGVDQPSKPPLIKGHEDKEPENPVCNAIRNSGSDDVCDNDECIVNGECTCYNEDGSESLSDKMFETLNETGKNVIWIEDVKEFIKDLKEEMFILKKDITFDEF